jgi:hypothetical protein
MNLKTGTAFGTDYSDSGKLFGFKKRNVAVDGQANR